MLKRKSLLNWLISRRDNGQVKVLGGARGSGKTVLLELYRAYLELSGIPAENILYVNFEHPDNRSLKSMQGAYDAIKEMVKNKSGRIYFLLDEITEVKEWQKLVNGIRVGFESDITITASNTSIFLAVNDYLAAKFQMLEVTPLSFQEYLENKLEAADEQAQLKLFEEYVKWGGFPALGEVENELLRHTLLQGIRAELLLKDAVKRNAVRDVTMLEQCADYLFDTVGTPVSIKKMAEAFKKAGIKTNPTSVDKYLSVLKDAFLFYEVPRYDVRKKEKLSTLPKYYSVDTGLSNHTKNLAAGVSSQLENIVYLELKRLEAEVFVTKLEQTEMGFVCFGVNGTEYFTITTKALSDDNPILKQLLSIHDNYRKTILTTIKTDAGQKEGIAIVPVLDWLLRERQS
ncbi:MAG: ATP-binding protein [Erysipelotrichaceae bacterium]|jgi:predicted AAA+ superfamily ATPase|nr:ATP-binding protein [Erysipelotrichaceae bacterium]